MLFPAKVCTPANRCPVASLKEAAHCSLHNDDAHRSIEFFAEQAGVRPSTLNDQINPDQPNDNISFRRLPALIRNLTNFALLDYLEKLAGRVAFTLPTGKASEDRAQAKAVREFGQYLERASIAGEDGEYTVEEVAHVEQEAHDAIAAIVAHVASLKVQQRPATPLRSVPA